MKNSLIILLLFTSVLHAAGNSRFQQEAIRNGQIDKDGFVTLTKKGQRASYYIVGGHMHTGGLVGELSADNEGIAEMIVLYPDRPTDVDGNDLSYCWRVLLHKDAKLRFVEPVKDQDGSAKTDIGGHLMIEHTGIKTIFVDSWPPPAMRNDPLDKSSPKIAHGALIIKTLDPLVRSGKIKIKKPPLTPEQRAERARRLLESGAGFIDSNNSSGPNTETEESDNGIRARDDKGKTRIEGIKP